MKPEDKICEWLGENIAIKVNEEYFIGGKKVNFLNDRNQQKWIEDKLIELGCDISYCYYSIEKIHSFVISDKHDEFYEIESKESKDIAFLQAVEQLRYSYRLLCSPARNWVCRRDYPPLL